MTQVTKFDTDTMQRVPVRSEPEHHYFASHGLGWATAPTLEEAIEKLWHARHTDVRKWLSNTHKAGELGLPFFTVRVPLPADATYGINFYMPEVEGLTEPANMYLTYYSQKKLAWIRNPDDEIRIMRERIEDLLDSAYLDWVNNYLTIAGYAEAHGITDEDAEARINEGRIIHERRAEKAA